MKSWKIFLLIAIIAIFSSYAYALKGCCERTNTGLYCVTAEDTECEAGANFAPTSCEQTSFCKTGCCYSSDSGRCFKSTPRAACASQANYTWQESTECNVPQCKKGCCTIGDQASYVTEVRCKRTASLFEGVEFKFDESVKSEAECIDQARSQEQGCCVSGNGCTFTTRAGCPTGTTEVRTANESRIGFHKDTLCSNDRLNCGCSKQSTTNCVGEDVYWIDSCGNRENIYNADRRASYNDGFVLKEEQSCYITSPNDPNCGNCDYNTGTVCGADKEKKMPVGTNTCVDVNCESTYEDEVSPNSGESKRNGESWCIFDTIPGQARDVVGSRHYRHLCINGEEITEPCKDFRDELCIQGVQGGEVLRNLLALQSAFSEDEYVEAACRTNRNRDCSACNTMEEGTQLTPGLLERRKECCDDETVRDCYWLPTSVSIPFDYKERGLSKESFGTCVAQVPRGLKFWGDASRSAATASSPNSATPGTGAPTATTPSSEASQVCAQVNKECKVEFRMSGLSRAGPIGQVVKAVFLWSTDNDWEITTNEHCTKHDWIVAGNNLCKSQGDCGAYYNIKGILTKDGYVNTAADERNFFTGRELADTEVGDFEQLVKKAEEKGFWDRTASYSLIASGAGILSSGVYAGIVNGDWEKFGAGINPIQSTVLGGIGAGFIGQVFTGSTSGAVISSLLANTLPGKDGCTGATSQSTPRQQPVDMEFTVEEAARAERDAETFASVDSLAIPAGQSVISVTGAQTAENQNANEERNDAARRERINSYNVDVGQRVTDEALRSIVKNGDKCSSQELDTMRKALAAGGVLYGEGGSNIVRPSVFGQFVSYANTYFWLQAIANVIDMVFTREESRTYKIECKPWVAPLGGGDCERCNEPFKPCSEYRCKSLGSTCELVNKGTSNESCISMDVNDVNSPIINPNDKVLTPPFTLEEVTEEGNKGFRILEKIRPFQPLTLGIVMNEPGQCKYDVTPGKRFESMSQQFGSSLYLYNQSIRLALPAELSQTNVTKVTNGEFAFYVRCQDGRGNKNERDYFIKFQVDPAPDLTPPVVRYTSVQNDGFISNNVTELDLSLYVDEPAECKWSKLDTGFEVMENSFTCAQDALSISTLYGGTFKCDAKLTGLQNKVNKYYVRCKDKPDARDQNDRIVNEDSYVFTLKGTEPLDITSSGPLGVQYTKKVLMTVTTAKGADNGKAVCGFSINDVPFQQMIIFANTNGSKHEQLFTDQEKGSFRYYIKCQDAGGNEDSTVVNFTVDVDTRVPEIIGLYADPLFRVVHIDFNEASTCEFRTQPGFRPGEGSPLGSANSTSVETTYRPEAPEPLYILCTDAFGNQGEYTVFPLGGE